MEAISILYFLHNNLLDMISDKALSYSNPITIYIIMALLVDF